MDHVLSDGYHLDLRGREEERVGTTTAIPNSGNTGGGGGNWYVCFYLSVSNFMQINPSGSHLTKEFLCAHVDRHEGMRNC